MEVRALRAEDDRSAFRSGDPDLDRFFHVCAGQNQFRHHIGAGYVAVDRGRIYGYATVAPGHIDVENIPAGLARRFPRYPLPILRLARLAVDESVRAKGVGGALLRFVFGLALKMAEDYGCAGIVVDAKPGAVEFYARQGFTPLEVVEGRLPARPEPVVMFLPIRDVRP